ncbi:hypothetical protein [Nonomuraea sp. NPDC049695]|uniref:hypothetical protein n=1 Tax=Nonomuraea sp. NPDC049695 TaxID=3154734 RepID=UPI003421F95B
MAEPEIQTTNLQTGGQKINTFVHQSDLMDSMVHDQLGEIRKQIDATDPVSVRRAGRCYEAAEPLINDFAAGLRTKAAELAEHYQGPSAYQTQLQLRSLHASALELAAKLGKMGRSLTAYGRTLEWAQANVVEKRGQDSRSDHDTDWADHIPFFGIKRADNRAADHLREVNKRIAQHYEELPVEVQQALPIPLDVPMPDFDNGGPKMPGLPAGPGTGYGNASLNTSPAPGLPGGFPADGSYPGAQYPGGPGTATTGGGTNTGSSGSGAYGDLDPGTLTGPTLGAQNGIPPATFDAGGSSGQRGATDLAGYDPLTASATPNGAASTVPGAGGSATGIGGGNAYGAGMPPNVTMPSGAKSAGGTSGMPYLPAASGKASRDEERDLERTTYLLADDDDWGADVRNSTTPPVIR